MFLHKGVHNGHIQNKSCPEPMFAFFSYAEKLCWLGQFPGIGYWLTYLYNLLWGNEKLVHVNRARLQILD